MDTFGGGPAVTVEECKQSATPFQHDKILKFHYFIEMFATPRNKLQQPYKVYFIIDQDQAVMGIIDIVADEYKLSTPFF